MFFRGNDSGRALKKDVNEINKESSKLRQQIKSRDAW